jgi:hypothetical protein
MGHPAPRRYLMNPRGLDTSEASEAKARISGRQYGTAEAVPFPDLFVR